MRGRVTLLSGGHIGWRGAHWLAQTQVRPAVRSHQAAARSPPHRPTRFYWLPTETVGGGTQELYADVTSALGGGGWVRSTLLLQQTGTPQSEGTGGADHNE